MIFQCQWKFVGNRTKIIPKTSRNVEKKSINIQNVAIAKIKTDSAIAVGIF